MQHVCWKSWALFVFVFEGVSMSTDIKHNSNRLSLDEAEIIEDCFKKCICCSFSLLSSPVEIQFFFITHFSYFLVSLSVC